MEEGEKIKHHTYSLLLVELVLQMKLITIVSFRALSKQIVLLKVYMQLNSQPPSRTTLQNWVEKIGYYQLTKVKEISDDWVILLDHSIQLGKSKLLVILGIRQKNIDFTRPLQYQDLEPLLLIPEEKWTGERLYSYLNELESQIGKIIYAVSDNGSDIRKGLELKGIPKIYDITHKIANVVKKLFEKDEHYQLMSKKMTEIRMKMGQTVLAHMLPPNQRKKSRYLNINAISTWAIKALTVYKNNQTAGLDANADIEEKFNWLMQFEPLIVELSEINQVIKKIEKIIKYNGLSKPTIKKCFKLLEMLKNEKGKIFSQEIKAYLHETKNTLPGLKKILCCSDILESSFGKYKSYLSDNPMACITKLCLSIAAFTSKLTHEDIQKGLSSVKLSDIKKWRDENIGDTLFKRRMTEFIRAA